MAETELLPCPFCGGEAELASGGHGNHYVRCMSCLATSNDLSKDRAIACWNARRPSPEPVRGEPIKLEIAEPPPWSYRNDADFRWLPVVLDGMTGVSDYYVRLPSGRQHGIAKEDYEALSPMRRPVRGEISDEAVETAALMLAKIHYPNTPEWVASYRNDARAALLAAYPHLFPPVVAEVAQGEPVGLVTRHGGMIITNEQGARIRAAIDALPMREGMQKTIPLYTHPQAADAVVEVNESLRRALRNLARAARTVFGALGPGQALQPAGAAHTNLLEATTNEADAVLSALVSHQGGEK